MWNEHFANAALIQSILSDDHLTAQAALAAGASALITLPRRPTSLLEFAIRLNSVRFVNLLMKHGAKAGPSEMATLVDRVQNSIDQDATTTRRLRAITSVMHRHGANFESDIEALAAAQPVWFRGLKAHCQSKPVQHFPNATAHRGPRRGPRLA